MNARLEKTRLKNEAKRAKELRVKKETIATEKAKAKAKEEKDKAKAKFKKTQLAAKQKLEKALKVKADKRREETAELTAKKEVLKLAEEEAHREQLVRLDIDSLPPIAKAKFISHDTEQRAAHRRIGAFYWFRAEQNGGECIGVNS